MKQRMVLALGGNMLQPVGGEASAEAQKEMAEKIGDLVVALAQKYDIVMTHGNGPQVGSIMLHEEEAATKEAPAMPLETAVAMTAGQMGYWLEQGVRNAFARQGREKQVVSLVTQVVVDRRDKAFAEPTKPIGKFYTAKEAARLKRKGWQMVKASAAEAGAEEPRWRRVVPSPLPRDIVEKKIVADLLAQGVIVITLGGGGVPVYRTRVRKVLKGVDAVVDKDYAAEKMAVAVGADVLAMVTAVPNAYIHYGEPAQMALGAVTAAEAMKYIAAGQFAAGSMAPKMTAGVAFARSKAGRRAVVTSPENLLAALEGKAGTVICG